METFVPTTFLPQNETYRHMEGVEFIYRSIEWEWLPLRGDADGNGRVDLRDFAAMQRCMPASDEDLILCLTRFDFDDSMEVSLEDYFEFATRMTGP